MKPANIICELCGCEFQKITNTHLKRAHFDWDLDRYKKEFGENSLMSDDWRWIMQQMSIEKTEQRTIKSSATKRVKMDEVAESFTDEEFQVVVSGLLGDSWIFQPKQINYPPKGTGAGYLSMQHKLMQLPYMAWKGRLLARFKPVLYQRFYFNTVKQHYDVSHQVDTMGHWLFGDMALQFYPSSNNFEKVLPLHLVEQLDPLGLAIWYQDDGCYNKVSEGCSFATNYFNPDDVARAIDILIENFDIDFRLHEYTSGVAEISVPKSGTSKFFRLIDKYIHPCLRYKIGDFGEAPFIVQATRCFEFDYGHHLQDYEGKCAFSHGHRGKMAITVEGPINPDTGFVADFGDLKRIAKPIIEAFDHKVLNDVDPAFAVKATAEVMVSYAVAVLSKYLPNLHSVEIWETPDCSIKATYTGNVKQYTDFLDKMAEVGEWWREIQTIKSSCFNDSQPARGR